MQKLEIMGQVAKNLTHNAKNGNNGQVAKNLTHKWENEEVLDRWQKIGHTNGKKWKWKNGILMQNIEVEY